MKDKAQRDRLIKDVTNDLLKSKFIKDVGSKAKVERSTINNEYMDKLRDVLREIGKNLEEVGAVPKGMEYCGSLSVHVYKSNLLQTIAIANLSALDQMPFDLADAALRELTGSTHETYGRSRRKLKSGF